ncbi:MAG: TlpA family protein disulfide reductase [Proteobacteria bacterium]|nr:TlpA family protein disulfide reductase [Pseudomonadota bacterium]MBU1419294.1 TlpA family protein disulfide reductase [Pseudomonadota bacterium]MBU1453237.1 TlpA family protein disulfide reductase [Pseudomonadota bacterium]
MKKNTMVTLIIFLLPFFLAGVSTAESEPDVELLPTITLTVPENKAHIQYLGLKGEPGTPFTLDEIDADILMIELFSMYCPYCQQAAPTVNELYKKMEQSKRPDLKIVLIGIGANNTNLEVDTFRKGFDIPFPLFSDPDMLIYNALAGAGTPGFIACKKDGENNVIFFRKSGGFTDHAEFFETLLKRAGVKEDDHVR